MDFQRPVEALVPTAQGRVLGALLHTDEPVTIRQLAELAGVSVNQASQVVRRLHDLGLVERTEVGPSSLIALISESPVVEALRMVADLRNRTLQAWRGRAQELTPRPRLLLVYGSWARGSSRPDSDVDVLAVLPAELDDLAADRVHRALDRWARTAERIAGLPVSLVVLDAQEAGQVSQSFWREVTHDAIVLLGDEPGEVLHAA